MKYPNCLNYKRKRIYSEEKISLRNYMYARHKPNVQWKEGEDYPDFSQIRSTQSFNWSAFSIPIWARFDDKKSYNNGYGVVGYLVDTIRNIHKYNNELNEKAYGVIHKPLEFNYSHCEIYPNNITKKQKREFRMHLKHKCIRSVYPNKDVTKVKILIEHIIMLKHRIFVLFTTSNK